MSDALEEHDGEVRTGSRNIPSMRFADSVLESLDKNLQKVSDGDQCGKDYPTGHSESKKKKRQTEEEGEREYQIVDRNGLCQLNLGSSKQDNMERDCCEFICGAPTTFNGYGIE